MVRDGEMPCERDHTSGNWVDSDETYLLYNFISCNQVNNYLYRLKINK